MDPKPIRKLEIEEIYSSLNGAIFMQSGRDYVPAWMTITGWSVAVSVNNKMRGISLKIQWCDSRGSLIRNEGIEIKPLSMPTYWNEEHWGSGLEGLLKMTISEEARLWGDTVANQIALGASWQSVPVHPTP